MHACIHTYIHTHVYIYIYIYIYICIYNTYTNYNKYMIENWRKHYLSYTEKINPRRFVPVIFNTTLKDSGNFSGHNYPSFPAASTLYGWTLQAATRSYVKITFSHSCRPVEGVVYLSYSSGFSSIDLAFLTSNVDLSRNLTGLTWTMYSNSRYLYIIYVSDQTVQRNEFTASFSSVGIDDSRYSLWGWEREFIIILRDLKFLFK